MPTCYRTDCRCTSKDPVRSYEPKPGKLSRSVKPGKPPKLPPRDWSTPVVSSVFSHKDIITNVLACYVPLITIVAVVPRLCKSTHQAISPESRARLVRHAFHEYVKRYCGSETIADKLLHTLNTFGGVLFGGTLAAILTSPLFQAERAEGSDIDIIPAMITLPKKRFQEYNVMFPMTNLRICPTHCQRCYNKADHYATRNPLQSNCNSVYCASCRVSIDISAVRQVPLEAELCAAGLLQESPSCDIASYRCKKLHMNMSECVSSVRYLVYDKAHEPPMVDPNLRICIARTRTAQLEGMFDTSLKHINAYCCFGENQPKPLRVHSMLAFLCKAATHSTTIGPGNHGSIVARYNKRGWSLLSEDTLEPAVEFLIKRPDISERIKTKLEADREREKRLKENPPETVAEDYVDELLDGMF